MSWAPGTRFSEYTPTDHQAPVWIATSITLAYAGLFLLVRLAVKFKVLALDDVALGVAYVLAFAQWGTMYAALHNGLGTSVGGLERRDNSPYTIPAKLVFASRILTLLILGFSKCSVVLFLRQFFAGTVGKGWHVCSILLIATGTWTFASTLIVSVGCSPSNALFLETNAQCAGDLVRWEFVTAVEVLFELILVVMPIVLFHPLRIRRSQKFTIVGVFSPRIIVPALFIAYLVSYIDFRRNGGTSIDAVNTLLWQQVLCGYSLVSATTPCLNGFLKQFRTHDLAKVTEDSLGTTTYDQALTSRSHPETYAVEMTPRKDNGKPPNDAATALSGHANDVTHSATAYADVAEDQADKSLKSFRSDRMLIHHKVEFGVARSDL